MKILFIASECSPIAKVGGLGDVAGALPKEIKKLGVDVRIIIPKYGAIDKEKYQADLVASNVDIGFQNEKINIYKTFLEGSEVPVYFLENDRYFKEGDIYFEKTAFVGSFKEIQRFLFFSKAVLEIFPAISWEPDIIQCNDWHTAILPVIIKSQLKTKNIKTLLTIHNLANQGKWPAEEIFNFLNLKRDESKNLKTGDKEGSFNILQQGILNADLLNTVSKTYSKEIQTQELGEGLEKELLSREKELYGILNGIDNEVFNPETDKFIGVNYSSRNLSKKEENKIKLQGVLGFEKNKNIPLLGIVSRLTFQKGVDLIIEIIPELIKLTCQIVILGVGEDKYEKKLLEFSSKYPKNISTNIRFDVPLGQKIYSGCDIFLMPSLFEPCGLGQMIAMRYGTIPIVRKTGGLAETVKDGKNGFVFEKYESQELLNKIKKALDLFKDENKWGSLIRKAMKEDFSWKKSAKKYLKLYKKLVC